VIKYFLKTRPIFMAASTLPPGEIRRKIAQERMICAIESGKLFVVALSNLASQNACDTCLSGDRSPARRKALLVHFLKFFWCHVYGLKSPGHRAPNFGRISSRGPKQPAQNDCWCLTKSNTYHRWTSRLLGFLAMETVEALGGGCQCAAFIS
jgi:hypothetical protein